MMPCKINLPPGAWTDEQKQSIEKELADRIGGSLSGMYRAVGGAELLKEGRSDLGSNERRPAI